MSSTSAEPSARILSIQSHVVSGYVGNRAAAFPLQLLGHEVDTINTVQFSNHTGYNSFKGTRFPSAHVTELFSGLKANRLDDYTHVLSGYIGTAENVHAVEQIVKSLKASHRATRFVLDPVLGDDGALYVPEELVALYRDVLCPLADFVTPNQFEAEKLTRISIGSLADAKRACAAFHEMGIANVVITSAVVDDSGLLYLVGSEHHDAFCIAVPKLDGYFTGAGDFFTALVVARYVSEQGKGNGALARACELAIDTQVGVMRATKEFQEARVSAQAGLPRGERPGDMVRAFELRIVPARHLIVDPVREFSAKAILDP